MRVLDACRAAAILVQSRFTGLLRPRFAALAVFAFSLATSVDAHQRPPVFDGADLVDSRPSPNVAPDADPTYLAELLERAHSDRIARDPRWHRLLHWNEAITPGAGSSFADDPRFFLATGGARDPAAELDATLRAFFAPADALAAPPPPRPGEPPLAQHPQCALLARRAFLDRRLGFDGTRLPVRECAAFDEFRRALAARGVTLVFPEAFLGSPASMFGHTFLRIDRRDPAKGVEPDLLGYAVNFSGATGEGDPGPLFAIKGLVGAYPGQFDVEPYWQRVRAYGDLERRDLWEYRLRLDAEQIDALLEHLWELQGVRFDYFYFDENCSLRLLELLAVALGDAPAADRLTAALPPWVIPVDAVRALAAAELIDDVHWRAAPATHLRQAARRLPRRVRAFARELALGDRAPDEATLDELSRDDRAAALDVAYELLHNDLLAGVVPRDAMATRARALLLARSRIGAANTRDPRLIAHAPRVAPQDGHRSARAGLASGISHDGAFVEARLRPALHDLVDPSGGYTAGAEVRFLDTAVRWHPRRHRVSLHSLTLVGLVSQPAWDDLLRPVSWHVEVGADSRPVRNSGDSDHVLRERLLARAGAGLGGTLALGTRGSLSASLDAVAEAGPALRRGWTLGPGASFDLRLHDEGDRFAVRGHARVHRPAFGDFAWLWNAGIEQRLALGRQQALVFDVSRDGAGGRSDWIGRLGFDVYF